jgi:altronate hydrolase
MGRGHHHGTERRNRVSIHTTIDFVQVAPPQAVDLRHVAIQLHPDDDVAITITHVAPGTVVCLGSTSNDEDTVAVPQLIPSGHKLALRAIGKGAPIHRYGQVIGFATQPIVPGEHVHSHNLGVQNFARDYAFGADTRPVSYVPASQRRTFLGYQRADGRIGTRNYIAVISSVNCSAHTSREIAHAFTSERLAAYPNVDGVIALSHLSGCGNRIGGADYVLLQRTLAGMARHPNIGAYIIVGLGCETNQIADLVKNYDLERSGEARPLPPSLVIQGTGGVRRTIEAGVAAIEELLPVMNVVQRTPHPVGELMLALQCGGSDGWSGVTANPLVGLVADEVVRQGGTAVLAETPEIYGAEHLLTRRAMSPDVGQKLVEQVRWWERHAQLHGMEIDNNPSPGNKAGGLTTIYEKSLGAVAKGGSTPLRGVYEYAEPVTARGFTFMNTPGYDPVSVTGQVAGGCNVVLFTTGRGSVFGFKPAPSIKISTNSTTYERMIDDMDMNAGSILEGTSMETAATELLDLVVAVASGQPSKSEAEGVGEAEFNPWNLGGTL